MMPASILLVEDSPDDQFLTSRILRRAGISDIRIAGSGKEALKQLFSDNIPDLMILDLRLPGIDGLEVLEAVRSGKKTQNLPVLVLSSSDDPNDRYVCRTLGAIDYLTKPLNLADFQKIFSN